VPLALHNRSVGGVAVVTCTGRIVEGGELTTLQQHPDRDQAIALVGEGFDMLEEDLDKETFFATARRAYWDSDVASPVRPLMQTLIGTLDF